MPNPKTQAHYSHPIAKMIEDRLMYYASERQTFEEDWRLDYDAWRRIYSETWKKGEGHNWRSKIFVGLTDLKVRIVNAALNDSLKGFPFSLEANEEMGEAEGSFVPDHDENRRRAGKMERHIQLLLEGMKAQDIMPDITLEDIVYGNVFSFCPIMLRFQHRRWRGDKYGEMPGGEPIVGWSSYLDTRHVLGFKHLSIWDVFKDPNAMTPQDGDGIGDRKFMSAGEFQRFTSTGRGFIKSAVNALLARASSGTSEERAYAQVGDEGPEKDLLSYRRGTFEVFRFWGTLHKNELENTCGPDEIRVLRDQYTKEEWKNSGEFEVGAVIVNIGETWGLVKISRNPFMGVRPYQQTVYRKVPHRAYGDSLPRVMRDSQQWVNSLARGLIDNLAFSAVATGILNLHKLEPGTDNAMTPGKFMEVREGFQGSVKDVLQAFEFPNYTRDLMPMIEKVEQWASEESVPNMLGGQTEAAQPETAYATSRLWEAAHTLLSDPLKNIDRGTIVPIVTEMYHQEMRNPRVPEEYKGDFIPKARGFKSFEDKHIKNLKMSEILQLALSSDVLLQLTKVREVWRRKMESLGENPDDLVPTDKELEHVLREMQQHVQNLTAENVSLKTELAKVSQPPVGREEAAPSGLYS